MNANQAILPVTQFVSPDEKAYWLFETWRRTPDRGDRRVQKVMVVRDDQMAVYEEDMGAWDMKRATPFNAPGLFEYSVAELRYMADRAREGRPPQDYEPLDLKDAFLRHVEEQGKQKVHASVYGPVFTKER